MKKILTHICVLSLCSTLVAAPKAKPENLALRAKVTATSEYSNSYLAKFACDGEIPKPLSKADINKAWVVKGNKHSGGVKFTLAWEKENTIAELVYYGRTGWHTAENMKGYEVYVGDGAGAIMKGKLATGHGPQRIKLPKPVRASAVTLKFLSNHGGPNPGASEIQGPSI